MSSLVHLWLAKFGRQVRLSLAAFGLAVFTCEAQAPEDLRVALVIGNSAYAHAPVLLNAANDARAMNAALTRLGFRVIQVVDADMSTMNRAIEQMQSIIKGKQAVAMFYFAGHGLQLDWRNYLMPVEVDLKNAADVQRKTIDVEQVLTTFRRSATRMNVIVLDACRDNPFASSSGSKGLAQVDAPPGTYLAFATAPGNVAEDGDALSGNGLFTQFLLKELQRPASIESVFKRVRLQVRQKSQGRQIPWDSSSLEEEFAFNDGKKFTLTAEDLKRDLDAARAREDNLKRAAQESIEREKQLVLERERELLRLTQAKQIQEEQTRLRVEAELREKEHRLAEAVALERKKAQEAALALERSRQEEANRLRDLEIAKAQAEEEVVRKKLTAEAAIERQFAEEKAHWDRIKDSRDAKDFYDFLLKYPTGLITQQASFALERLEKAKIASQADRNGVIQETGEPRFRVGDRWVAVTRNLGTGKVIRREEFVVDRIEKGFVYYGSKTSQGIMTLDGAAVRSISPEDTYLFDPPRVVRPAGEVSVGMRWTASSMQSSLKTGFKGLRTDEFKVIGYEKIEIPAGAFWAYKIEQVSTTLYGNKVTITNWYSPNFGPSLRNLRRAESTGLFGVPLGQERLELREIESFQRGSGNP
jgi:uncharacterized caspase-like protein